MIFDFILNIFNLLGMYTTYNDEQSNKYFYCKLEVCNYTFYIRGSLRIYLSLLPEHFLAYLYYYMYFCRNIFIPHCIFNLFNKLQLKNNNVSNMKDKGTINK